MTLYREETEYTVREVMREVLAARLVGDGKAPGRMECVKERKEKSQ